MTGQTCEGSFKGIANFVVPHLAGARLFQNGCAVYITSNFSDIGYMGTISGATIQYEGKLVDWPNPAMPNVVVAQNRTTNTGTIQPGLIINKVDWTGSGHVSGRIDGVAGSCSITTAGHWIR